MQYCKDIPGAHVKNLFLRNKKKTSYFLVTVKDEKTVDLLTLGEILRAGRLSFGSSDDLIKMLSVQPGELPFIKIFY
jgi:Ala-tRNA(Pro) deacylase